MIGIDLFSGAGGMSLGALQAGIDVRLAIEFDPHATATYTYNHSTTRIIQADIRCLNEIDIDKAGQCTILFGGPPCQGFSTSNQRTRKRDNPTNWLFLEFLRVTQLWKPNWVVFENVTGLKETAGGVFLEQLLNSLKYIGYTTTWWILNASDFGVPQRRSRLFVVASLDGMVVSEPKATCTRHVTVREAITDLPDLPNGASENILPYKSKAPYQYAKAMRKKLKKTANHLVTRNAPYVIHRYKHIPQGGNWQDIPRKLMRNYADYSQCHTGIYHRLDENEPSVVIGNYRKNMLIHPTQDRGLSVREAARLQSFPDWYEFRGSIGFQQQQVGNAVPPMLAQAVFEAIVTASGEKRAH
jgi:DNA (cytosine-5)-methyltransferase 1